MHATGQTTDDCEYRFTVEPLPNVLCNPYAVDEVRTACAVVGQKEPFIIDWVWRDNITGDSTTLEEDQFENIDIQSIMSTDSLQRLTISTRLRITALTRVDHVGWYWCQVRLSNGTVLSQSRNSLLIRGSDSYDGQRNCSANETLSEQIEGCASSVSSPDSSNPPEEQSTTVNTNQATSPQPQTKPPTDEPGLSPALYLIIGVVIVFGSVIITLTVTIVVLYRRKCANVEIKPAGKSTRVDHCNFQSNMAD